MSFKPSRMSGSKVSLRNGDTRDTSPASAAVSGRNSRCSYARSSSSAATNGEHQLQSIVVGYYENTQLRFAARVRAGFTAPQRAALFERLRPLKVETCPFTDLPSVRTGHWGEGVTVEDMKILKWVKPTLVAEIAFTEWTRDGNLRHSAFVGMRSDQDARAVVREHPAGGAGR